VHYAIVIKEKLRGMELLVPALHLCFIGGDAWFKVGKSKAVLHDFSLGLFTRKLLG